MGWNTNRPTTSSIGYVEAGSPQPMSRYTLASPMSARMCAPHRLAGMSLHEVAGRANVSLTMAFQRLRRLGERLAAWGPVGAPRGAIHNDPPRADGFQ